MKKILGMFTAGLAVSTLIMLGVSAAPVQDFTWTAPTQYEDGNVIPASDVLGYKIYCGVDIGGPYPFVYDVGSAVEAAVQDVGTCVQGVPGTYYFVATATSSTYAEESAYSGEVNKTYTAADLGRVPLPPTLLSVL